MPPDNDLRADLESAIGGSEDAGDASPPAPPAPPAPPSPPEPSSPPPPVDAPAAASPGAERDSLGRFLPKKEGAPGAATPAPGAPISTPGAVPGSIPPAVAAPAAPAISPPAGWSPAVREHWAKLPQPVQEYIHQREQQMQRWANDTAPMRQAGEQFMRAIEPYRMTIQAEGVDPLTAITNLMQVGQTLRFGTPNEKASIITQCIQAYGVDIQTLDAMLAGAVPPAGQPTVNIQAEVQRALAPLMQAAQQRQQLAAQQANEQAGAELLAFAQDPAHEFIEDVRGLMADMLEVADRQNMALPLQDAYDRACALHPEVSKVIMARRQGVNAQQLTQNAQRAKAAAVSVRGAAPVGNPSPSEPSSIRESIEAAIEAHSRV